MPSVLAVLGCFDINIGNKQSQQQDQLLLIRYHTVHSYGRNTGSPALLKQVLNFNSNKPGVDTRSSQAADTIVTEQ